MLEKEGLGHAGGTGPTIALVPAPLLRASALGGRVLTPMPFLADSTYRNMHQYFDEVFKLANPPGDPDPEFNLQGHAVARFGNHSWRQYSTPTK